MKINNKIQPITSAETIRLLGEDLRSQHMDYYLVYRIIIETGITLSEVLSLRAEDLRDKEEISVKSSKRYRNTRNAPLSGAFRRELNTFLEGKADYEYAFTSRFTGERLSENTFKTVLKLLSKRHDIDPPITVLSLIRTYKYNKYLKNPSDIFNQVRSSGYDGAAEYFGIDLEDRKNGSPMSVNRTVFYKSCLLDKVRKKVTKVLKEITKNTERPDMMDDDYYKSVLNLLSTVNDCIEDFEESVRK